MKRYKQRRPTKISRKRIIEMSPQNTSLLYLYQLGQSSASYLNALIKNFKLWADFFEVSNFRIEAYPSVYSTCNNPRYASHLLPITFPQVKQRTGIIIFVYQFSIYDGEKNILKASLLHLFTSYLSEDSDILRKLNRVIDNWKAHSKCVKL